MSNTTNVILVLICQVNDFDCDLQAIMIDNILLHQDL